MGLRVPRVLMWVGVGVMVVGSVARDAPSTAVLGAGLALVVLSSYAAALARSPRPTGAEGYVSTPWAHAAVTTTGAVLIAGAALLPLLVVGLVRPELGVVGATLVGAAAVSGQDHLIHRRVVPWASPRSTRLVALTSTVVAAGFFWSALAAASRWWEGWGGVLPPLTLAVLVHAGTVVWWRVHLDASGGSSQVSRLDAARRRPTAPPARPR